MKALHNSLRLLAAVLLATTTLPAWGVRVTCRMAADGRQIYEDERVMLSLRINTEGQAELLMWNKTDWPIDVNRGRSFAYVGNDASTLFLPSVHTESHTETSGVILREANPHGLLHDDHFYGDSHTSRYSEADRPIQPLAPHGSSVIYTFASLPELMDSQVIDLGRRGSILRFGRRGHFVDSTTGQRQRFRRGQQHRYNEADSPLRLAAYVQYGYADMERGAESHAAVFHADVSDYVQQVTVGHDDAAAGRSFSFRSGGGNFWPACGCAATAFVAVAAGSVLINAATF